MYNVYHHTKETVSIQRHVLQMFNILQLPSHVSITISNGTFKFNIVLPNTAYSYL